MCCFDGPEYNIPMKLYEFEHQLLEMKRQKQEAFNIRELKCNQLADATVDLLAWKMKNLVPYVAPAFFKIKEVYPDDKAKIYLAWRPFDAGDLSYQVREYSGDFPSCDISDTGITISWGEQYNGTNRIAAWLRRTSYSNPYDPPALYPTHEGSEYAIFFGAGNPVQHSTDSYNIPLSRPTVKSDILEHLLSIMKSGQFFDTSGEITRKYRLLELTQSSVLKSTETTTQALNSGGLTGNKQFEG